MNKHAFEGSLLRGIPQGAAVSFLHRLKTAGWGDPPDESGELEGAFAAPVEQVIASLTVVAAAKFQLMLAYHIYSQSMRGVAQHAVGEVFLEHAEMERAAGEAYLKRAAVLGGGPVHLGEIEPPPASADPVGILMLLARAEQEAIAAQRELKAQVGEENPLTFQIEQFMIEDQHHLDELWQMLPQDVQHTPVLESGESDPAAAGGTAGMEAPPELPGESPDLAGGDLPEDPALPPADAAPPPPAPPGPPGPPGLPGAEEEPELPPAADAGPPPPKPSGDGPPKPKSDDKPKPKAEDKPKPKEPSESQKEAFAIGFANLLLKQAGIASDIIEGMSPSDKKKLLMQEKLRSVADAVPLKARSLADGVSSSLTPLKGPVSKRLLSSGAGLGAILGASSGANMTKTREKQLRSGGPINRFRAEHPMLTGAGFGAAAGFGGMAGGLMSPMRGGVPLGILAGAVVPGAALSGVDRALKRREDKAAAEGALKEAFVRGLRKLGFSSQMMPEPGAGTDPGAAPMPEDKNAVMPQPSMAAPGPQPPMATPPGQARYAPVNYLEAEETARRAQAANESGFYRDQASQAQQQVASMGAQAQQIQAQLDQLTQQAAESQSQIMAAQQEATTANDQMLNQATLAARMRMGMQQLRAQMMEIASQDPEQLAAAAGGPTPMDVGQQAQQAAGGPATLDPTGGGGIDPTTGQPGAPAQPGADPGAPGAAPAPDAGAGSPPAAASQPAEGGSTSAPTESGKSESSDDKKGETTVSIKKAHVSLRQARERIKTAAAMQTLGEELVKKLPYMGAGALAGGAASVSQGRDSHIKTLREQVNEAQGKQDGGFGTSLELAKAHMALSQAEDAKQHPVRSALAGGLAGAGLGAAVGAAVPATIDAGKRFGTNISSLRRAG